MGTEGNVPRRIKQQEGKMNKEECCTGEQEKEEVQEIRTDEEQLLVLPIYNAYRAQRFHGPGDAFRLTFLEVQYRVGCALTWPGPPCSS